MLLAPVLHDNRDGRKRPRISGCLVLWHQGRFLFHRLLLNQCDKLLVGSICVSPAVQWLPRWAAVGTRSPMPQQARTRIIGGTPETDVEFGARCFEGAQRDADDVSNLGRTRPALD